jgi:hypothetical protein
VKAAIGRIVHVIVDPNHNNGSDVAPAVITRVWSDTCVNLRILYDGPAVPLPGIHRQEDWLTSWTLYPSREELEAHYASLPEQLGYSAQPAGAFWPPRDLKETFQEVTKAQMAYAAKNL